MPYIIGMNITTKIIKWASNPINILALMVLSYMMVFYALWNVLNVSQYIFISVMLCIIHFLNHTRGVIKGMMIYSLNTEDMKELENIINKKVKER